MTGLTSGLRTRAAVVVLALSAWMSGCATTVDGTAVRAQDASPQGQSLVEERDLDEILLTPDELDQLLGTLAMEINNEIAEMTDDSSDVSDPDCLGTVYTAEEPVYEGTGFTAVLTRLASEAGDDYEHWVEQTAVVLPSAEAAEKFVDESERTWNGCAGSTVSVYDGEGWHDWELMDVVRNDGIVSQVSENADFGDWQCEHALTAASNVVIEVSACSEQITDEATTLVTKMVAKAADR